MIFDPALKRVWCLFEPQHSFPIHLSRVEWQVLVPVDEFDSVVRGQHVYKSVWISLNDWCSKTHKCIPVRKVDKRDKYAIND